MAGANQHRCRAATSLLVALLLAQQAHALTFSFNAVGTGANKGVRAAIAITINQPLASILADGVVPTIAPTVTYSLKLSKPAQAGYQAALFGATGTMSDPATAHAVRFAEVSAGSAIPPTGFAGDAFDILPECSPACGRDRWCYKTNTCDCKPDYGGPCPAIGSYRSLAADTPAPSIPIGGRRLLADGGGDSEQARAAAAIAKSLRSGEGDGGGGGAAARAGQPRGSTVGEQQWELLEGIMGRLCDGDMGVAIIKDTGVSPPILVKLPTIYRRYYCQDNWWG